MAMSPLLPPVPSAVLSRTSGTAMPGPGQYKIASRIMSPRSQYNFAFSVWGLLVLLLFVSLYLSLPFGILLFIPVIVVGIYTMRIRCPHCKNPFYYVPGWANRTKPIFPIPKTCPNCGGDLSEPSF